MPHYGPPVSSGRPGHGVALALGLGPAERGVATGGVSDMGAGPGHGAGRGRRASGLAPAMLITLCYLYLWARWGRRPAALVLSTVRQLRTSRCSFTFCGAAARPGDARVCLSRGGRVFCVGESQVGGRRRGGAGEAPRGPAPLPG